MCVLPFFSLGVDSKNWVFGAIFAKKFYTVYDLSHDDIIITIGAKNPNYNIEESFRLITQKIVGKNQKHLHHPVTIIILTSCIVFCIFACFFTSKKRKD